MYVCIFKMFLKYYGNYLIKKTYYNFTLAISIYMKIYLVKNVYILENLQNRVTIFPFMILRKNTFWEILLLAISLWLDTKNLWTVF